MRTSRTIVYYSAFALLGLTAALLGPTIDRLAVHAGSTLAAVSVLFTAYATGYLIGSLIAGRIYDRIAGHPMLAMSVLMLGLVATSMPEWNSLLALIAAQVVLGLAGAGIDVGGNSLLVWTHGKENGPYMNGLHLMFGVGGLLAPTLVAFVLRQQPDIHWAYRAVALLALPIAALAFWVRSPARAALAGDATAQETPARANPVVLTLLVLFFFMIVAAEASLAGWVFNYAKAYGADDGAAAGLNSAFWAAFTVGRVIAIPISTRVVPGRILLANTLLCLGGTLVMLAAQGAAWPTWIAAIAFGIGMGPLFATAISFAEQHMRITGAVTGWFLAGASLSSMTIPFLIGQGLAAQGPFFLPVMLVAVMIAAFVALLALNRVVAAAKMQFGLHPGL